LSSAKEKWGKERNEERKEKKRKEKKRKEVRGNPHIKSCESQIFKFRSRSTVKRSWSETWRYYRRLYDASILQISRKKDLFCESYELLKILHQIWFFGQISFCLSFFGYVALGSYRS
jgi:hypothetical protein